MTLKDFQGRGIAWFALAACLCFSTAGCFGKFELTRRIYNFNKRVDSDKWVQWLVFLVISIIPVYGLGLLIDLLFANSVEFWTGSNPVSADAGSSKIVYGPDGEYVKATRLAENMINLEITGSRGEQYTLTLVRDECSISAYSSQGMLLAIVQDIDGSPAFEKFGTL